MTNTKKVLVALLAVLCICAFAFAGGSKEPIKVIYTNDAHCGYGEGQTYAGVAAVKKALVAKFGADRVTLIDAGDAIQGDAIGTVSNGAYLVDIMNYVGYDYAIFGNHEFDYGMDTLAERIAQANAKYLDATFVFTGEKKSENKLKGVKPYEIVNYKGTKVAYIGVSTAETKTKSTPTYFMNEEGEWIYDFLDHDALYDCVQGYVDEVHKKGADFVIIVSHLGCERETDCSIAQDLIANTHGIDVVIDGHSHTEVESEYFKNENGVDVLYTQTGTKLANIGVLTIIPEDGCYAKFVTPAIPDADTQAFIKSIEDEFQAVLLEVVAKASLTLSTNDANGIRMVRNQETAIGDLCADAYRLVSGADIGFANGGGIRADLKAGDITYENIISVFPYSNMLCMCEATGQEILDALEWGSRSTQKNSVENGKAVGENGGFLQVSGLKYTIDTSVANHCVSDSNGMFVSVDGERRVKDVYVGTEETGWTKLDPAKTYTVACHNYKLKSMGDGYTMFVDNNYLIDETMIDNQLLIAYIKDYLNGTIGDQYAKPQGRITII